MDKELQEQLNLLRRRIDATESSVTEANARRQSLLQGIRPPAPLRFVLFSSHHANEAATGSLAGATRIAAILETYLGPKPGADELRGIAVRLCDAANSAAMAINAMCRAAEESTRLQ